MKDFKLAAQNVSVIDYYLYRVFLKLKRSFFHVIVCVVLKSFSQNHLSKMCKLIFLKFF
jgi:hypothetical protein